MPLAGDPQAPRTRADPVRIADAAFEALRVPETASLDAWVRSVEAIRGTRLTILPLEQLRGTSACGLLVAKQGEHTIYYVPASSALHATQCILHELSHLVLRHDERSLGDVALNRFVPDIRLDVGDKIFGRVSFEDDAEIAAERLADRLAGTMRSRFSPGAFEEFFG